MLRPRRTIGAFRDILRLTAKWPVNAAAMVWSTFFLFMRSFVSRSGQNGMHCVRCRLYIPCGWSVLAMHRGVLNLGSMWLMDFIIMYSAVDMRIALLSPQDFSRLKIFRTIHLTVYRGEPQFCKPISYCSHG